MRTFTEMIPLSRRGMVCDRIFTLAATFRTIGHTVASTQDTSTQDTSTQDTSTQDILAHTTRTTFPNPKHTTRRCCMLVYLSASMTRTRCTAGTRRPSHSV
ncbi:MAG: hypothetical protein ABI614_26275 [Planctomycetota bacterium]